MQSIDNALAWAVSGSWHQVLVTGRPGMGKSRLIHEAISNATRLGFLVLSAETVGSGTEPPTGVWNQIVDQLTEQLKNDEQLLSRLSHQMKDYREEVVTAMPGLAELFGFSSESLAGPEELGQSRIVAAYGALISSLGAKGHPVLIALDGCERIDDMSLRIVRQVSKSVAQFQAIMIGVRVDNDDCHRAVSLIRPTKHINLRRWTTSRSANCANPWQANCPNARSKWFVNSQKEARSWQLLCCGA